MIKSFYGLIIAGALSLLVCTNADAQNKRASNSNTKAAKGDNNNRPHYDVDVNTPRRYKKPTDKRMDYRVLKNYPIKQGDKCNAIGYDEITNNIYICMPTKVAVMDMTKDGSVSMLDIAGVGGIAFFKQTHQAYITNTKKGTISMVDLHGHQVSKELKVGDGPTTIFADNFSKKLYVCNEQSKDISVVDIKTFTVINTIKIHAKAKAMVSDNKGKIYIAVVDRNEVLRLDVKTMKTDKGYYTGDGRGPSALAIDTVTRQLYVGCLNRYMPVISLDSSKVIQEIAIPTGCGGVVYDPFFKTILATGIDGRLTLMRQGPKGTVEFINDLHVAPGARLITMNEKAHHAYMVAFMAGDKKSKMPESKMDVLMVGN